MKNAPRHPVPASSCPSSSPRLRHFALLPVPVFLAAIGVLAVLPPTASAEEPALLLALNLVFSTLAALGVVALVARSYLRQPSPDLLALGCGVLLWGAAGTVGPAVLGRGPNATVTVHNLLVALSALCHFTGGVLVAAGRVRRGRPMVVLGAAYAACVGIAWGVTAATLQGRLPVFFVPGQGGTPVRQAVLVAAAALFIGAVAVLWRGGREARTAFLQWYGLALLLVATGLVGVLAQKMTGSALNWTARAAMLLGGAYMVAAAVAALRESGGRIALNAAAWDDRLLRMLTPRYLWSLPAAWRYALALGCVVAATALRVALIPVFGTAAAYYVMLATAVGATALLGLGPGLLTLILAGVAVDVYVFGTGFGGETFARLGASMAVGLFLCYVLHGIRVAALKARASEERLRLANERYELVLEGADAAIWDWDVANHRVLYSPRWKALRGLGEHEVTDAESEWSVRIHSEDAPRVRAAVEAHFAGCTPVFAEEYRVRHKDGHWLWIADRGLARRDAAGHVIRMAGSETDITARKQSEEKLRLSEETLAKTFDAAAAAMALTRLADGRLLSVNDRWLELMESRREGVIGKTSVELECWKNPADREAILRQVHDRGVVRDFECVLRARNGREWTALFSARTVTIRGERVLVSSAIDITARKRTEEALRESEARFRLVLKNSPVLVTMQDARLVYQWVYNTRTRLPEEVVGKTDADLFAPDEAAALMAAKRRVLETGTDVRQAFWLTSNGQRVFLDCYYEPVRDAAGRVIGVGGASVNLTEQKRVEEALAESHRQTQSLIDNATSIIYAFDLEERFILANAAVAKVLNTTPAQLLGKRRHEFMPKEDADWHEANDREAIAAGAALEFEEHSELSGRSITWLTTKFPLRDAHGTINAVAGISADISDRKRMEAALGETTALLETLLAQAPLGFAYLDRELRFVRVNEPLAAINGLSVAAHIGKTIADVVPALLPTAETLAARILATGEAVVGHEISGETSAQPGVTRCWSESWYPVRDVGGGVVGFGVLVEDITARKQMEAQLKAALLEKEVLLKEIHHRVKNNMQVLSSLVNLQEESLVKSLANGHSSLDGGGELQDQRPMTQAPLLSAFAEVRDRIRAMALVHESLYQSESLASIDFAQYANGLAAYLSRAHGRGAAGVRLRLDVEPVSLQIESAVPCGLILNELVTNAYKHAFRGRPSGEVVVRLRADSAGQVSLAVSDDGQGMPAEFDWRQAPSLGLRLVRMLAGQLEGTAECRRREGGGTEFVVAFGVAADDQ